MQLFTQSEREKVDEAFSDLSLSDSEAEDMERIFDDVLMFSDAQSLIEVLRDGYISQGEMTIIDRDKLSQEGLDLEQRRTWHTRIWMPQLPSGEIKLNYNVDLIEDVPRFNINVSMEGWTPFREILTLELNGLARADSLLVLDGFDTSLERDILIDLTTETKADLIIPRNCLLYTSPSPRDSV